MSYICMRERKQNEAEGSSMPRKQRVVIARLERANCEKYGSEYADAATPCQDEYNAYELVVVALVGGQPA